MEKPWHGGPADFHWWGQVPCVKSAAVSPCGKVEQNLKLFTRVILIESVCYGTYGEHLFSSPGHFFGEGRWEIVSLQ